VTVLLALAVGFLGGRLAWTMLAHTFAHPIFERSNYRGEPVVTAAGVVLPLVLLVVEGGRALAGAVGTGTRVGLTGGRTLVLLAVLGFGLLGTLDDLVGGGDPRGFRGHVAALLRGRLTLGGMKLVGGVAVALVAVAPAAGRSGGRLVADAALVALSANLGNLLDRAPGRVTKAGAVGFAVLAVGTVGAHVLGAVAVVMGAALALFRDDLRERLMLGDVGANALGAALGIGVVLACAPGTRTTVLIVVAALNLLSEVVSFSRAIDAVPPLRFLDRVGRRR